MGSKWVTDLKTRALATLTPLPSGYFWMFQSKIKIKKIFLEVLFPHGLYILPLIIPKTSPEPVKSLGYIMCYSSSSIRPVKYPTNSIRYNCQICSRSKSTTVLVAVFSWAPLPNIPRYRDHQWDLTTIWKTRFFQTFIGEFR